MVSVTEASSIIQNNLWKGGAEQVELLDSLNRILAEDMLADRDFPPYNRVTMDGIAIAFEDYLKGNRVFKIEGTQAAGMSQGKLRASNSCLEVMTGAILPEGCDTIIRYEDLKIENGVAEVTARSLKKGDSVHKQGSDAKFNSIVLNKGATITSGEIPLFASVGISKVKVRALPKTALVSTGDELVDINEKPKQHQTRKSNVYALAAGLKKYNIEPFFFHLQDNEKEINEKLSEIVSEFDLVILSGGVSKGKFDFIPVLLEASGIIKHFHQVKQRPGKPMWFGTGEGKTVFALPGNPVSTFLCYYKYVEPWLVTSLGGKHSQKIGILDSDFSFELPLTYFLQVQLTNVSGKLIATPVQGGGSGDFVNLKDVDGFLELPQEEKLFKKGSAYPFVSFRS
jgi:molybdopterin molybdotransferase